MSRSERFDKSDAIEDATPGNWILTATSTGLPPGVGDGIEPTCTWPIDADATGIGLKSTKRSRQSLPRSARRTSCICQSGM